MVYIQYVISLRVYWDLSMFLSFNDVETCIRQLSSLQIRFIHPCKACVYILWGIKAWSSILITSAQRVHCGLFALTRRNLVIFWCPPVLGVVQAVVPHWCFLPGVALSAFLCTHSVVETFMTFLWTHHFNALSWKFSVHTLNTHTQLWRPLSMFLWAHCLNALSWKVWMPQISLNPIFVLHLSEMASASLASSNYFPSQKLQEVVLKYHWRMEFE